MAPKVIDEYSFKAREQEIIDASISLIDSVGIENITIDKVVTVVPYSKGTIYKHFIGKEDLVLAIGNQAITIMHDLFSRAALFQGCARERMMLLSASYLIYAILHPTLFISVQCAKSPHMAGKSSEARLQEQEKLEEKIMMVMFGIIGDALENQYLTLPKHMDIKQVTFATWAPMFGTISLLMADDETEKCSGTEDLIVETELFNQINILLDGLRWAPYSDEKDYAQSLNIGLKQVFPSELALMKAKGRELNFS